LAKKPRASMRQASIVPTNLLNWPKCDQLSVEDKYILLALWSAPFISSAGFGELPHKSFSASLNLLSEQLAEGLNRLVKAKLLTVDKNTNEIFINDWFRFHVFKTEHSRRILKSDLAKIQSKNLKKIASEKSMSCVTTATSTSELCTATPTGGEKENNFDSGLDSRSGLILENQRDLVAAERMISEFGIEKVRTAAGTLPVPYPTKVRKLLEVDCSGN